MGKKILIIEDNSDDMFIIGKYLAQAGYSEIITATDAVEGIKKAKEEAPDLVISDTLLPGHDGFEVCSQIRDACGKEKPKVIIMTGSIDVVDAVKARKVGADDYCAKASDCAPLIEAVKRVL